MPLRICPGWSSQFYLVQDPVTRITNCTTCGAGRARGTMVGVASCACPAGGYAVLSPNGQSVAQCAACPTVCPAALSLTPQLTSACPACAPQGAPPFASLAPGSPPYACTPPLFSPAPGAPTGAPATALGPVTGSSLYVPSSAAWTPLVAALPYSTCNPAQVSIAPLWLL